MAFSPEFVAVMSHKLSKQELVDCHKALKKYSRKVSKKADLMEQLGYLLYGYELLYNQLQKRVSPDAKPITIDKTKLSTMTQNELLQLHTLFRRCLKYTSTKQGVINNILAFAKQVEYYISY